MATRTSQKGLTSVASWGGALATRAPKGPGLGVRLPAASGSLGTLLHSPRLCPLGMSQWGRGPHPEPVMSVPMDMAPCPIGPGFLVWNRKGGAQDMAPRQSKQHCSWCLRGQETPQWCVLHLSAPAPPPHLWVPPLLFHTLHPKSFISQKSEVKMCII